MTPITKHSWIWHFVAVAACSSDFITAGRLHQLEDLERATASAAPSEPAWRQLVTVRADTSSATSSARERAFGTDARPQSAIMLGGSWTVTARLSACEGCGSARVATSVELVYETDSA